MASKFQNRLVGTVILVALSVIVLPDLLDGNKKQSQESFTSIPLVPRPGDDLDSELIPSLPAQPSNTIVQGQRQAPDNNGQVNTSAPVAQGQTTSVNGAVTEGRQPPVTTTNTPSVKPSVTSQTPQIQPQPPQGKAFVIQLGALKNAQSVTQIVGQLRGKGYRVYTLPATPVQGNLTRIMVGPDTSREKLQSQLSELSTLTGLNGQIKSYAP